MQRLAKNLSFIMVLLGFAVFIAIPSTVSCNEAIHENSEVIVKDSDNSDKKEFWDKFRESVKPREENPKEKPPPKETHPKEKPPREANID